MIVFLADKSFSNLIRCFIDEKFACTIPARVSSLMRGSLGSKKLFASTKTLYMIHENKSPKIEGKKLYLES